MAFTNYSYTEIGDVDAGVINGVLPYKVDT